jgi:streptogramin lyase
MPCGGSFAAPHSIAFGSDDAVWFTTGGSDPSVERLYIPSDSVMAYTGSEADPVDNPHGIVAGPDGQMWFTNHGGDTVGSASTDYSVTVSPPLGSAGAAVTITGAGFADNEQVDIDYYPSAGTNTLLGAPTTTGTGTFSFSTNIPLTASAGNPAMHKIRAVQSGTGGKDAKTLFLLTSSSV